jgi:hypothetical protein
MGREVDADRHIGRQTDKQTNGYADKQICRQTGRQRGGWAEGLTG